MDVDGWHNSNESVIFKYLEHIAFTAADGAIGSLEQYENDF